MHHKTTYFQIAHIFVRKIYQANGKYPFHIKIGIILLKLFIKCTIMQYTCLLHFFRLSNSTFFGLSVKCTYLQGHISVYVTACPYHPWWQCPSLHIGVCSANPGSPGLVYLWNVNSILAYPDSVWNHSFKNQHIRAFCMFYSLIQKICIGVLN